MTTEERRKAILETLKDSQSPCNASVLAEMYGVSRQVIVTDIALLRASGNEINATPRGYIMSREQTGVVRRIVSRHNSYDTGKELYLIVDNGCTVLDVVIEHPVYGELVGSLQLKSRYDVGQFLAKSAQSQPLSALTGGVHLHTIACPDEESFQRVYEALKAEGFLVQD